MADSKKEYSAIPLPMLLGDDEDRNIALMFLEPPTLIKRSGPSERRFAIGPLVMCLGGAALSVVAIAQSLIA